MTQAENINRAIRLAGVIWHPCNGCGRDWPFPTGYDPTESRDWQCHVCVVAFDAETARASALLIAQAAQLETLKKENDDLRSRVAPLTDCVDGQDLPQSGTGEQSSLPSGSDHEHDWYVPRRYAYPICRICGVVQRRDGQNKPCKGPTTLREMEK